MRYLRRRQESTFHAPSNQTDGSLDVVASVPVDVKLLSWVRRVGVEHLCDIEEHTIHRAFDSVSHYLQLVFMSCKQAYESARAKQAR